MLGRVAAVLLAFLAVIGVVGGLVVAPASAATTDTHHCVKSCGGCTDHSLTIVFHEYQSQGYLYFGPVGGTANLYGDQGTTTVKEGCGEQYQIGVGSTGSYAFHSWASDAGYFLDPTSTATTFTPDTSGTHGIAMVLTQGKDNWGAYVATPPPGISIHKAAGSFQIPGKFTYVSSSQGVNAFGMWVGLGGSTSSLAFWQAGVYVQVFPSQPMSIVPFFFEAPATGAPILHTFSGYTIKLGDRIDVSIVNSDASLYPAVTMTDGLSGWSFTTDCNPSLYPGCSNSFTGDGSTAEWGADAQEVCTSAGCNFSVLPDFTNYPINWYADSMSTDAYPTWDMAFGRRYGITNLDPSQFLSPGLIYSDGFTASGNWALSYTTTPG